MVVEASESSVKMKLSIAIFGPHEYACEYGILSSQSFIMRIKKSDSILNLQLSFKHIHRVELLDNEDDKGAGMIFHINSYMTSRIQETLDKNSRSFVDHQTPYSQNGLIIIDVLNADRQSIRRIKDVLIFCEQYHRNYVIEQWARRSDKNKEIDDPVLPVMYIFILAVISYNQWKTLLGYYRKDVIFETIEIRVPDTHRLLKYTVGRIVASQQDVYSIQWDGRLVALHRDNGQSKSHSSTDMVMADKAHMGTYPFKSAVGNGGQQVGYPFRLLTNRSATGQSVARYYSQSYNDNEATSFGEFNGSPSPSVIIPRRAAEKREIHTIEDEESASADLSTSKRTNDTVFVYPPSGSHGCSIHYADLKFLDHSYMLNDTIIDFYLKYVYYELIPNEIRLSQPPPNTKPYLMASNRWKRVSLNFQFVKSWTKKINLFDMDYIVVPINEDIHWYLAIIINPRRGITSDADDDSVAVIQPNTDDNERSGGIFIVVLDSLADCDRQHSVVRDILAEYLRLEYIDKRDAMSLTGRSFDKTSTRLVIPSGTPQQKNFVDCGVFLLKFAELFMKNPPTTITTRVSFRSWYPNFQIKGMRDEIKAIIRGMAPHVTFADFLPPNATPTFRRKGKKRLIPPINTVVSPLRQRRHSDSSVRQYEKESQFMSLDLSSRSRSLYSIIQQLKFI